MQHTEDIWNNSSYSMLIMGLINQYLPKMFYLFLSSHLKTCIDKCLNLLENCING